MNPEERIEHLHRLIYKLIEAVDPELKKVPALERQVGDLKRRVEALEGAKKP